MRKIALLALVPLVLAGTRAQAQDMPGDSVGVRVLAPQPWLGEPLRFVLNEPAYVAAFMIYPGSGVRMIYPEFGGQEQPFSAGYHSTQLYNHRFDDDEYNVVLGPKGSGPYYLYVIASRHPLDLDRFVHRPASLANAIGSERRSFYVDVEFDALVNNAIALGDDSSWGADSYMIWPGSVMPGVSTYAYAWAGDQYQSTYVMRCNDGRELIVPSNFPFGGCPNFRPRVVFYQNSGRFARSGATGAQPPTVLPTVVGRRPDVPHVLAEVPGRRTATPAAPSSVAAIRQWGEHPGVDHTVTAQAAAAHSDNHGFWHHDAPVGVEARMGAGGRPSWPARSNGSPSGSSGATHAPAAAGRPAVAAPSRPPEVHAAPPPMASPAAPRSQASQSKAQ